MISRALWIVWLSGIVPSVVLAEAPVIVVTPHSAFAEHVAERLRAGLDAQAGPIEIVVDDTTGPCEDAGSIETHRATITIDIASDNVIHVCVHTEDGLSTRLMGPLAALDATAVEQVATVAEASLEALRTERVAPPAESPTADSPTASPPPPTPPLAIEIPTTPTEPIEPRVETTAHEPAHTEQARAYVISASYQPTLWNGDTIAHHARIGAQASVLPAWLWLGAGLGFTLPFDKLGSGLGASFGALALDLRFGVQVALSPNATFHVSLGPRLEWLFVGPFVDTATRATAARSSDAFSLGSVIELGPTIQISGNLSAAFGIGAIFTHNARNYVVTQGDSYARVMDQSIPRPYVHVGAQLAL